MCLSWANCECLCGIMNRKVYTNFVKPSSPKKSGSALHQLLSGIEAQKLYLEEVKDLIPEVYESCTIDEKSRTKRKLSVNSIQYCEKELFLSVQNNDIDKLSQILDAFPDKVNISDTYGWSLLMIACQANSVDIVKELLKRGVDTSVRDKAGNSACSLVIKNRNLILADLLLSHKSEVQFNEQVKPKTILPVEIYICDVCNNKKFANKQEHLSSTLHNINASKGKKIPTNYAIPQSNKGYQIMLKGGWDKETGLGPDGSGNKYPIKPIKKTDKTGLGHKKKQIEIFLKEHEEKKSRKLNINNYYKNKQIEINFRRQFY